MALYRSLVLGLVHDAGTLYRTPRSASGPILQGSLHAPAIERGGSPMQMSDIHDYARQLLGLHGDKARAIAAQKAVESDKRGEHQEAADWRRIRDALAEMRGPHFS
jgi:hypothetical protein